MQDLLNALMQVQNPNLQDLESMDRIAPKALIDALSNANFSMDEAKRQAALTGRYLASGAAGLGSAFANPLAYVANKGLDAAGSDYRFPEQYEALQQAMTSAGLPEPQGGIERGIGFASEVGIPDPTDFARVTSASKSSAKKPPDLWVVAVPVKSASVPDASITPDTAL